MQQEEIFAALEEGVTVVTANQRLARRLAICYASVQQARGLQVWETPDVLPWPAWIARVWTSWFDSVQKADPIPPALLAPEQEQVLWEISIRECERDNPLFDVHSAATLAREAWDLWRAWRLQLKSHEGAYTQDTRTFLKWTAAFESRCKTGQFIDSARVADALADRFTSGQLCTPARLVLAGFDEFTPQQRVLFEVLRELGCEVTVADTTKTRARRVVKLGVPDAEREVRLAACWARARLEQNPKARIGIIVPDLGQVRMRIERVFEDILQPGSVLPDAACDNTAYHISLGLPLAKYPVIHTALIVLDLSRGPLALTQVGNLLRSPFTKSGDSELSRRALLDARLRELGVSRISWRKLAQLSRERDKQGALRRYACPVLAEMLSAFGRIAQALPDRQSPGAWTRSFGELLHAVGWPGERTLSSEEFQTVEAWGRVLQSLAGMECIVQKISLAVGLSRLRQVAQAVFQPESPDAPVQVLGILETSGERFDYLWLMGMHDESWPRAAGPNPLLPIALQRTHSVPHASAERELEYARKVTQRLFMSAPEIVVSYPRTEGERDLFPSPLIADLEEIECSQLSLYTGESWTTLIHKSALIETLSDASAPPLAAGEKAPGGTRLLEDQAACPFRAFATHRLGARTIEEPALGLDPRARGSLVHAALEQLWSELHTHQRLCTTSEDALRIKVRAAVDMAFDALPQQHAARNPERFYTLERKRLEELLMAWLELEKRRAPFKVVECEQPKELIVGGLILKTRVDRIDELVEDGQRIIIDYKTGQPKALAWLDPRLEQPQLPLYSIYGAGDERPIAVLLAHVEASAGQMKYHGVAARKGLVPEFKAFLITKAGKSYDAWGELFNEWRQALETLAAEISTGKALIDPKKYPVTCTYCELPMLCRKHEVFAFYRKETDAEIDDD